MTSEGAVLLDEVTQAINRFLSLPPGASEAMALWVFFTHTFEATDISPRLALLSPMHGCGKTTALSILSHLCPNSLLLSNVTPAAVFRFIEKQRLKGCPTLMLDEGGTYLQNDEAFLGILNSGHTKAAAKVLRTVQKGRGYDVQEFSTWAPIAMAKIGALPSQWASRSITINLQRKRDDEKLERFKHVDVDYQEQLSKRIAKWAKTVIPLLKDADPSLPITITNRARDNWRPLVAIAELAGEEWPDRARKIALAFSLQEDVASEEALLGAIRRAFDKSGKDRLRSEDLCTLLHSDGDERFAAIQPTALSRQLKPFGIHPRSVRFGTQVQRGYERKWFEDAFARYLPR
jgi:putative DNA primase/helicase